MCAGLDDAATIRTLFDFMRSMLASAAIVNFIWSSLFVD
jgi:hypothetical protein